MCLGKAAQNSWQPSARETAVAIYYTRKNPECRENRRATLLCKSRFMNCLVPDGGSFIRAYDAGVFRSLTNRKFIDFWKRCRRCRGGAGREDALRAFLCGGFNHRGTGTEKNDQNRISTVPEEQRSRFLGPHCGVPQDCNGNGGSDTRNGMWLCWRREIPPFAKAAKDGPPTGW